MPAPESELTMQTAATTGTKPRLLSRPLIGSLLPAAAFFALYLLVLRPGYDVNDDVDIIGLASGYFTGKPVPYLPNSNVLWGLLLGQFYALPAGLNWEVLFFIAINFASVWVLLFIVFSRRSRTAQRLFGMTVVLVCDAYFLLNITFTTISAFAALAGVCALLMATAPQSRLRPGLLVAGAGLVLTASLIRLTPMLLVLLIILPALLLSCRSFDIRKLIYAAGATGLLVLGCYALNLFFVGQSPAWSAFYKFNVARESLKDTPRMANIQDQYRDIGWSKNDLREFSGWFFPDKELYSTDKLQYLVTHVSNTQKSKLLTVTTFAGLLVSPPALPYLLVILAGWLAMLLQGTLRRAVLPLSLLTATFLAVGVYVAWAMKLPYRVLLPGLAADAIFGLCILDWAGSGEAELHSRQSGHPYLSRILSGSILLLLLAAAASVLVQSVLTTQINLQQQTAYDRVLSDLNALQAQGRIDQNALILSPAYGIPLEWSDPLAMDFPRIRFLDMGWLTLSPAYDEMLREFAVPSIPAGFYQKNNVYLMTRADSLEGILEYIKEHEGVEVQATGIYALPDTPFGAQYNSVHLYQLAQTTPAAGK